MPKRIQLRRTKDWRKPPNTVVCARPSKKWGNRFRVLRRQGIGYEMEWVVEDRHGLCACRKTQREAKKLACLFFKRWGEAISLDQLAREELAGADYLACWCPVDDPNCHVEVILRWLEGQPK